MKKFYKLLEWRWSYTIPFFTYLIFFILIWLLPFPLKPTITNHIDQKMVDDNFEIRMKNSNFDSDRKNINEFLDEKNEYLINHNPAKDQTDILREVFYRADTDGNRHLDSRELANWIRKKIVAHITSAVSNNNGLFALIDTNPTDGVVTWKEYHAYFLSKRGFSAAYVRRHDEKRHRGMRRALKEQIRRDRASWSEAARSDPDALTADEFLAFTHPESSAANQLVLVDEMYDKFDRDGDELLTEDEFAILRTSHIDGDEERVVVVRQDENERRVEFRKSIDLNGDGRADRRELLHYVAPQSPRHSEHEAEALLSLADTDNDRMLSLAEMLAHPDLFLRSKMVDTGRSFHDEF